MATSLWEWIFVLIHAYTPPCLPETREGVLRRGEIVDGNNGWGALAQSW